MSFNEDALPPTYADVVGDPIGIAPSAPPIAVPLPSGTVILGFEGLVQPAPAVHEKEREAAGHLGYGATTVGNRGPGFEPEDDSPAADTTLSPVERAGRREFVIRFTCPSCDCSNLVPHCGNLTCCTPDLGFLNKLKYMNSKPEANLFSNYSWSKITDRHFRYFFHKPEDAHEDLVKYMNTGIFLVFVLISAVMFFISPWAAIASAIVFECDQDSTIRPLLGAFGAVVLAEAFLRSTCYFLHKIDRPPRAIKELESPNALLLLMLILFILLMVKNQELTPCDNSTILFSQPNTNSTSCCDSGLIKAAYGVPISWLVFEVLVMLGTSLKFVLVF